jgi:hypothetical protein
MHIDKILEALLCSRRDEDMAWKLDHLRGKVLASAPLGNARREDPRRLEDARHMTLKQLGS